MGDFDNYTPPDWDSYWMDLAYKVAHRSKDPRTKIGTLLIRQNSIISTGYNGFPRHVVDSKDRYENRNEKYKFVAHSEANSVFTAARLGISTDNSICYTMGIPCHECMKALIQGGIKEIVCHKQWPDMTHSVWLESVNYSKIMALESGINIRFLDKVLGCDGYLDGKIIKV